MTRRARDRRRRSSLALLLARAARDGARLAGPGEAATSKCPATFRVLHNDRIGKLKLLRKGNYRITLVDDRAAHAAQRASKLFARFLQDFDGELGERLVGSTSRRRRFSKVKRRRLQASSS